MKRDRFTANKEAGLSVRPARAARERRLIPWWARALNRVRVSWAARRQAWGSLGSGKTWRGVPVGEHTYSRRSVVKAAFKRNDHSGSWAAHARYLSREGAQREQAKGVGFDAEREGIDIPALVRDWEKNDKLLWRFIVSPEDADRIDLKEHARGLVGQMERDLGTKLQWVAIDHHNTDDAHVHLLVRGVRENGSALQISRDYLRRGMRGRSQEIVTKELGPRLEAEVLQARERTIGKERWTEIDRAIQRKADSSGIVSYEGYEPHSDGARVRAEQEIARLRFLEGIGLARQTGEAMWQLSPDHERDLRARQQSKDILKSRSQSRTREADRGLDRGFERRRDFNG
ncbi:MAG: relaxase/mobilization nuclease domain-containing protein [Candidatus Binataceae bacterium]